MPVVNVIELNSLAEIQKFAKENWPSYSVSGAKSATWEKNAGKFSDICGLGRFHHTSFASGLLEPPVKPNGCLPTFGPSFRRASLKNLLVGGNLPGRAIAEFRLLCEMGIEFPKISKPYSDFYYDFGGFAYNSNLRRYAMHVSALRHYFKRGTVCEIGAGYGGFAELFHLNCEISSYIVIDLFETMCVSMSYLWQAGKRIIFVESGDDVDSLPKGAVLFIPSPDKGLAGCAGIDLFVNQSSMTEMPEKEIDAYFSIIQQHDDTMFYNFNCKERVEGGKTMRHSDFPYDSKWVLLYGASDGSHIETLKMRQASARSRASTRAIPLSASH